LLSEGYYGSGSSSSTKSEAATKSEEAKEVAAPGRVEPSSGEFRLGAATEGAIVADVPVQVNWPVEEGELLVRLDDEEARARLASAEAQEGLSRRERDAQPSTSGREDVTKGEDGVYSAEREVTGARFELDAAVIAKRKGDATDQQLADARKRLAKAQERVERERLNYAQAQAKSSLPAPNRFESALTAARAQVALAGTLLDKTRLRAPIAGTVLEVNTKKGELVSAGLPQPLIVMGDMSTLYVKAEIDDGNAAKIERNQKAYVQSINYPGEKFPGTVIKIAPSMAAPRINPRGPQRLSDIEVLEITIALDGKNQKLRPGMRVDAFVKAKD
jgi:HlyD family secretion protein